MKKRKWLNLVVISMALALVITNAPLLLGAPGNPGGTDPQCTSGGPGSTYCSGTWEVWGASVSCEVSCGDGYYACCFLKWNFDATCICKANSSSQSGGGSNSGD